MGLCRTNASCDTGNFVTVWVVSVYCDLSLPPGEYVFPLCLSEEPVQSDCRPVW